MTRPSPGARVALTALRAYKQWVAPLLPPACRYWPSCSEYAWHVIARRGLLVGSTLAVWRLLRCQPLCSGGSDPPR